MLGMWMLIYDLANSSDPGWQIALVDDLLTGSVTFLGHLCV